MLIAHFASSISAVKTGNLICPRVISMRNGITFRVAPSLFAGRGGLIFGRVNAIWLILSNG